MTAMTANKQGPLHMVMRATMALKDLAGSPAFMTEAYAKRYLGSARLKHLSLLHYVTIGEERGYLPNPFFDPAFFQKEAGTRRLVDFLNDQRLWIFATSPYFDTAWYVARHAGDMDTYENPLLHFLSKGFQENFDPAPGFETIFFRKAVGRDEGNKLRLAFEWLSDPVHRLPVSMAALEAQQQVFLTEILLNTLRLAPQAHRRNLVFVQAGSAFEMAGLADTRSYDLMLNYYEPRPILPDHADYIFHQVGTKASGVFTLWSRHPDLFARYDAVLFLDDDVSITPSQIERLFALQAELGADLLQASLTPQSACFFPVLKQPLAGPGVRKVTAVEIMMPVVSRRAMAKFGWVFGESISGWGVDLLLSAKVREAFGDTIWLAGEVVCAHEREVDRQHGSFYRFLRARGLDATAEAGRIALKYGVNDKISAINFLPDTASSVVPDAPRESTRREPSGGKTALS